MKVTTILAAGIAFGALQSQDSLSQSVRNADLGQSIRRQSNSGPPLRLKWMFPKDPRFRHLGTVVLDKTRLLVTGTRFPEDLLNVPPEELKERHIQTIDAATGNVISDWKLPTGTAIGPVVATDRGVIALILEWTLPVDKNHPV